MNIFIYLLLLLLSIFCSYVSYRASTSFIFLEVHDDDYHIFLLIGLIIGWHDMAWRTWHSDLVFLNGTPDDPSASHQIFNFLFHRITLCQLKVHDYLFKQCGISIDIFIYFSAFETILDAVDLLLFCSICFCMLDLQA